jgi:hypothetical protein
MSWLLKEVTVKWKTLPRRSIPRPQNTRNAADGSSTGGEASHEPQIDTPPHAQGSLFTYRVVIGTVGGSEAQHDTDQQDGLQHAGSRQATPNSCCRRPQARVGSGVLQSAASLPQEHQQQHVLPVATIMAVKLPHQVFPAAPSLGKWIQLGETVGWWGTWKKWKFGNSGGGACGLGLSSRPASPLARIPPPPAIGLRPGHPSETTRDDISKGQHRHCPLSRPVGHEVSGRGGRNKTRQTPPCCCPGRVATHVQGSTKGNGSDGTGVRSESCQGTSDLWHASTPQPSRAPCDCCRAL